MTLPSALLRVEALALFLASLFVYHFLGGRWGLFAALLLVPDLSMLGFVAGPRIGSYVYNAAHTLALPAGLAALVLLTRGGARPLALLSIWFAHIAIDRVLGYGLKYPTGFRDTHLQRV